MQELNKYDRVAIAVEKFMKGAEYYANAKRSKNGEIIQQWLEDHTLLKYYLPFFRSIEGKDHTYFVIDVDVYMSPFYNKIISENEQRILKLSAVLDFFSDFLQKTEHKFFAYISGQGLYLVQKFPYKIDKSFFLKNVWNIDNPTDSLFKPCQDFLTKKRHKCDEKCNGWFRESGKKITKIHFYKGIEFKISVDLNMYSTGKRLFRVVYSPYFKMKDIFFATPVYYKENGVIDIDKTLMYSSTPNFELKKIDIPLYDFYYDINLIKIDKIDKEQLDIEDYSTFNDNNFEGLNITRKSLNAIRSNIKRIPDSIDKLKEYDKIRLQNMRDLFSSNPVKCPPCIYNHFKQETDRFWSRMVIVRYLIHKGYTINEVAKFLKFFINDDEDNSPRNKHKLALYLPHAVKDFKNPYMPPSCETMRNEKSQFYGNVKEDDCLLCGRFYCLENIKLDEHEQYLLRNKKEEEFKELQLKKIKSKDGEYFSLQKGIDEGFIKINTMTSEIIKNNQNTLIIKSTRCGVTTSLVKTAVEKNKKILVVAPTNAIGFKTLQEAKEIVEDYYKKDVKIGVIANNLSACTKLVREVELIREKFPNAEELAFLQLPYHNKPSCISVDGTTCPYFDKNFDIEKESLIGKSDNHTCALSTIIQNINKFDVLFVTYDKLRSMMYNEDNFFIQYFYNNIDIVFLDEVSHLVQKPPLSFTLLSMNIDDTIEVDFLQNVTEQLQYFISLNTNKTILEFINIIEHGLESFKNIIDDLYLAEAFNMDFSEKIDNLLDEEDKINMRSLHRIYNYIIENLAKKRNIYLKDLNTFIDLLKYDHFYLNNNRTLEKKFVCSIATVPTIITIRKFLQEIDDKYKAQIIVTDATLPFIEVSDILQIDLKKYVIGDPRLTNEKQLLITDTQNVSLVGYYGKYQKSTFKRLKDYLISVTSFHDPNNIMIVAPHSKKIFKYLLVLQDKGLLDKKIELTYFRSDKTIGVSSNRRIMIVIGSPYIPPNSSRWLASYYKELNYYKKYSLDDLTMQLDKVNAYQSFYQTIGRVKDPKAIKRSIVYIYGLKKENLEELLAFDQNIEKPKILSFNRSRYKHDVLRLIGILWLKYSYLITPLQLKFYNGTKKLLTEKYMSLSKLLNKLKINNSIEEILTIPKEVLYEMGLGIGTNGRKYKGQEVIYVYKEGEFFDGEW